MPQPQFEPMVGAIDGANAVFTTPTPYTVGTVAVYVNGQLQMHNLGNPWVETDPGAGTVTLSFAPQGGDTVVAFYLDTTPVLPETEIEELEGTLSPTDDLVGGLDDADTLAGSLDEDDSLTGALEADSPLAGSLDEVDYLEGELDVCDE